MLRLGPRSYCREGFKKLAIRTVPCLYIYALMLIAVKILIFIKLTPLFMVKIQGSKINCTYPH